MDERVRMNDDNVRKTAHALISLIADCAFRYRYPSAGDPGDPPPLKALYTAAGELYRRDPDAFSAASGALLCPDTDLPEEDVIRLECAGLYGRDALWTYLLRLRFFLDIADDGDTDLMRARVTAAYADRTGGTVAMLDRQRPWEKLIGSVLGSTDPADDALSRALESLMTPDAFPGIDGAVAYTFLCADLRGAHKVPARMKTAACAVTGLAVIRGDGLRGWLVENGTRAVHKLAADVRKLGLAEAAAVLGELASYLTNVPAEDDAYNAFEARLEASYTDEELTTCAEAYLKKTEDR